MFVNLIYLTAKHKINLMIDTYENLVVLTAIMSVNLLNNEKVADLQALCHQKLNLTIRFVDLSNQTKDSPNKKNIAKSFFIF